jgi:hypothetical protein
MNPSMQPPYQEGESVAPDLRQDMETFCTKEFYDKVLAAWLWNTRRFGSSGQFDYYAPWRPKGSD